MLWVKHYPNICLSKNNPTTEIYLYLSNQSFTQQELNTVTKCCHVLHGDTVVNRRGTNTKPRVHLVVASLHSPLTMHCECFSLSWYYFSDILQMDIF